MTRSVTPDHLHDDACMTISVIGSCDESDDAIKALETDFQQDCASPSVFYSYDSMHVVHGVDISPFCEADCAGTKGDYLAKLAARVSPVTVSECSWTEFRDAEEEEDNSVDGFDEILFPFLQELMEEDDCDDGDGDGSSCSNSNMSISVDDESDDCSTGAKTFPSITESMCPIGEQDNPVPEFITVVELLQEDQTWEEGAISWDRTAYLLKTIAMIQNDSLDLLEMSVYLSQDEGMAIED